MATPVREIKEWLNTLSDDQLVGVDDGGLCIRVSDDPFPYLEIGGLPEDEEEPPVMACPKCGKELHDVVVYSTCAQKGALKGNVITDYGSVDVIETRYIQCPECLEEIQNAIEET